MSNCNEEKQTCNTKEDCCPVEKSLHDQCCPIEKSVEMWQKAFFCAMKETTVDILKEKIRKTWGSTMEKEADAVIEAMGTHWQSLLQAAKAQSDLKDNITKIYKNVSQK